MIDFLPFALPDICRGDRRGRGVAALQDLITTGPKTKEFERRFAEAVGTPPHAVMVNSCTAALHLALEAVGVKGGRRGHRPDMTFAATAEVVRYLGAVPGPRGRPGLGPQRRSRGRRARRHPADQGHHPGPLRGLACDMDESPPWPARAGSWSSPTRPTPFLPATGAGTSGTLADITCFSFYATKTITTAEGGAVVTDQRRVGRPDAHHGAARHLAGRLEALHRRGHLVLRDRRARLQVQPHRRRVGARARPARARRDMRDAARRRSPQVYDEAFGDLEALDLPTGPADRTTPTTSTSSSSGPSALKIDRDSFIEELKARGIGTSVHFIPLHLHPYYRETFGYAPERSPWRSTSTSAASPSRSTRG